MTPSTAPSSPSAPVRDVTVRARDWPHVSLAPHSPHAVAFRVDDTLIGVVHHDGRLDLPVPLPIRTVLVDEGLAEPQPARAEANWVTVALRADDDVRPALLLLRLSYLYRRLLHSPDPTVHRRIRAELSQYDLPAPLTALYDAIMARRAPAVPLHLSISDQDRS